MSSKHWESHVMTHCVISSIYLVTVSNRKKPRQKAKKEKGGVEKTRRCYDLMSAACCHSENSLQCKYFA